jgi:hypothetical protein
MGVSVGSKNPRGGSAMTAVVDIQDPRHLDALAKRLLAFARRFAAIRGWWLNDADALAKGNTVEDVVRKALVSLYGGDRRWDPTKYPDPWVYLKLFVGCSGFLVGGSRGPQPAERRLSRRSHLGIDRCASQGRAPRQARVTRARGSVGGCVTRNCIGTFSASKPLGSSLEWS